MHKSLFFNEISVFIAVRCHSKHTIHMSIC